MKHPLTNLLSGSFEQVENWELQINTTLDQSLAFKDVFKEIKACSDFKTKWNGLNQILPTFCDGNGDDWKEVLQILAEMRNLMIENELHPEDEPVGMWKNMIHAVTFFFVVRNEQDIETAKVLMEEVSFFGEDSYRLHLKISDFYLDNKDPVNSDKWFKKAEDLERNLIKTTGMNHKDRSHLILHGEIQFSTLP